ncbi:protein MOS2 [Malania oleifera]|uniref:protein MOS2 n=1 Tax=Malania oleifera TaxID=397392 RepID=UPI0025ADB00B|nr:protein MOS2 [Malania oleifera]XP_057951369.1 protein MOS2 [Malania oleifera]
MKLSFSLAPKQSSRPNIRASRNFNEESSSKDDKENTAHEYVTEFEPSKTLADSQPKKLIIPPKQNEWRPEKKMRNLDIPLRPTSDDSELRFEAEAPSLAGDVADDSGMSYGLNLRQNFKGNGGAIVINGTKSSNGDDGVDADAPQQFASGVEGMLLQKLKDDLRTLPEDRGFAEFDDVPVEGFGAALLAGYGWYEGRGIGRNTKKDVKVYQFNKRTGKEGLGFIPDMPDSQLKGCNVVLDGQHVAGRGSRCPKWLSVGRVVRILDGRDAGSKGKVLDLLCADSDAPLVSLKLARSGKEVTLHIHEVAKLGSIEEEKCLKKLKELDIRGANEHKDSSSGHKHRERREGGGEDKRKDNKRSREEGRRVKEVKNDHGTSYQSNIQNKEKRATPTSWLTSDIRVRIISKDLGGRLYLKKGKVVDVVGPKTCDISMDHSGELIERVDQGLLETALPCRGGRVLILYGKHKGVLGNLVEKDLHEETGVVQDIDSHVLLNVHLEQIAEYVGDPSSLDY